MPVPSNISELSTTPANNSPAGTETPGTADDYLRTHAAFIATLSAADSAHVAASDPHPAYALETDVSATLANYAPKASPALTGTPTAPTATAGTNTKQIATTEFVQTSVTGVSTTFASSAENAAGTVENKAVDPLGIREAFNATGSAPVFACRAWVNFNGTGTVSIRASGNVSSITDNGTGDYTVNFLNGMSSVNYSVSGSAGSDAVLGHDSGRLFSEYGMNSRTTLSCRVCTAYAYQGTDTTVAADASLVSVQVV